MVSLNCPLCCDQSFEDQQALFSHLQGLRNNIFCPICSDRFSSLELLVTHLSRKCYGPQPPLDAKKRSLSNISLNDNNTEDQLKINENQHSKPQENEDQLSSYIPFEIPDRLLKNISISIKETGQKSSKQNIDVNHVKPILESNASKNPIITNGLPLNSVNMVSPSVVTLITPDQNEVPKKHPGTPDNSSIKETITKSSDLATPDYKSMNKVEAQMLCQTKLNSIRKVTSSVLGKEEIETLKTTQTTDNHGISTNLTNSNNMAPASDVTPSIIINPTNSSNTLPEQSQSENIFMKRKRGRPPLCKNTTPSNGITKRKRGRPRKYSNLFISNGAITVNGANEVTQIKENILSNSIKDVLNKSSFDTNGSSEVLNKSCNVSSPNLNDDDDDHFEESMEQNVLEVDGNTPSTNKTSGQQGEPGNAKEKGKDVSKEEEEGYTCSVCNVRFTSIYEHIKLFHNGEEVVVEVPENEIKEDLKAYKNEMLVRKFDSSKTSKIIQLGSHNNENQDPISKSPSKHMILPEEISKNLNLSKPINKLRKPLAGEWLRIKGKKRIYYHYVTDKNKMARLMKELKVNQTVHPDFKIPIKELFENPKINVIAITNQQNAPFYTYDGVDLNKSIPMYVIVRQPFEPASHLGGIASYVLSNPCNDSCGSPVEKDTKVIVVVKVILASDQTLTVENLIFQNKPAIESMIPVLEDIIKPDIPMLEGGKMLRWRCNKCMYTTWEFPLNKDSHLCNGCLICEKPFSTSIALKKHIMVHKMNITNYCQKCHLAFITSKVLENHLEEHENHQLCSLCNLFVPLHQEQTHKQLHSRMPVNQFPCSVCHKVFTSKEVAHGTKSCDRLVAKYNCSLCDKKFFSLTALTYHSRDHKYVTIRFPCRYCPKTFRKEKEQWPRKAGKRKPSNYLQKMWHERIHTRDRPYLCPICPKRFRSLDHQTMHCNQVHYSPTHKDVPIYVCNMCKQFFQNQHKLEKHKNEQHVH